MLLSKATQRLLQICTTPLLLSSQPLLAGDCGQFITQKGSGDLKLTCNLTLSPEQVLNRRLIIEGSEGSNITVNCQGGTLNGDPERPGGDSLEIRTKWSSNDEWSRPSNILIKDCTINGAVRIWGMNKNGEGSRLKSSSFSEGHTRRARETAPRDITFDKVNIFGRGRIPLYLAPGVSKVTVKNSKIAGWSSSTAVYLDAESTQNTFLNNRIEVDTEKRELVAIDGSSHNVFSGNTFSSLNNGGLYLYRNCGEGGTIRHATPSFNVFTNNYFYYNRYKGRKYSVRCVEEDKDWTDVFGDLFKKKKSSDGNPALFIGSRDGERSYCKDDRGYAFGSSASNLDHATYNIAIDNQIRKLSPSKMMGVCHSSVNHDNFFSGNQKVGGRINRHARCALPGKTPIIISHDSHYDPTLKDGLGLKWRFVCEDGVLSKRLSNRILIPIITAMTMY